MQLPGGNILRVAQDAETVWSVYDGALPAIVLSCVALMLAAAILSTLLTRALVQPVLNMTEDLDHIQDKVPYKELIPFAESIHADRILRENNEKTSDVPVPAVPFSVAAACTVTVPFCTEAASVTSDAMAGEASNPAVRTAVIDGSALSAMD